MAEIKSEPAQETPALRHIHVNIRRTAEFTYGFILDDACLRYWAKQYHAMSDESEEPFDPDSNPSQFARALRNVDAQLPRHVYTVITELEPIYRRLIMVRDKADGRKWRRMFVLKDNKKQDLKQDEEVVERLRLYLGVGEQQKPAWYHTMWPDK